MICIWCILLLLLHHCFTPWKYDHVNNCLKYDGSTKLILRSIIQTLYNPMVVCKMKLVRSSLYNRQYPLEQKMYAQRMTLWHENDCRTVGLFLRASNMELWCLLDDSISTLRPRQNGHQFDTFKCIYLNQSVSYLIEISFRYVPWGRIDDKPALFKIMAWHRPGDKPLCETMMRHPASVS